MFASFSHVQVVTVHQFERINRIHITALGGVGGKVFHTFHDHCVHQQQRQGESNQPPIFAYHFETLMLNQLIEIYTTGAGGKEAEKRIFGG